MAQIVLIGLWIGSQAYLIQYPVAFLVSFCGVVLIAVGIKTYYRGVFGRGRGYLLRYALYAKRPEFADPHKRQALVALDYVITDPNPGFIVGLIKMLFRIFPFFIVYGSGFTVVVLIAAVSNEDLGSRAVWLFLDPILVLGLFIATAIVVSKQDQRYRSLAAQARKDSSLTQIVAGAIDKYPNPLVDEAKEAADASVWTDFSNWPKGKALTVRYVVCISGDF